VCSFDVFVEPLSNKEKVTTFFDQNGTVRLYLYHGGLKARLTNHNQSTSKSVVLNISGPFQVVPHLTARSNK
jgi:hypothetical protein